MIIPVLILLPLFFINKYTSGQFLCQFYFILFYFGQGCTDSNSTKITKIKQCIRNKSYGMVILLFANPKTPASH